MVESCIYVCTVLYCIFRLSCCPFSSWLLGGPIASVPFSTHITEGREDTIYILTHCGLYIVCMQVQPVPVRVIVRLPYNRPEDPPSDPAPVSLRQNSNSNRKANPYLFILLGFMGPR